MSKPYTLLDVVNRQNDDFLSGIIEEATESARIWQYLPIVSTPGIAYTTLRRVGLPGARFRHVGEGTPVTRSQWKRSTGSMHYLTVELEIPDDVAMADGRAISDIYTDETVGGTDAALLHAERQIIYGTEADEKGFVGFTELVAENGSISAGANANTTEIFLASLGSTGCQARIGNEGDIGFGEWTTVRSEITPASGSKPATYAWGKANRLAAYLGFEGRSENSVWHIGGINPEEGKHLTDLLGLKLLSQIPYNRRKGLRFFASKRAAFSLEASRESVGNVIYSPDATGKLDPRPIAGVPVTILDTIEDFID